MNKRSITILFIIIACILNTVPKFLDFTPPYDCQRYLINYKFYTLGQALSFSILILVAISRRKYDKVIEIFLTALFWLSINDVMDELLFDPYKFGFNEVIFALIIISHAAYQYRQYKRTKIDSA